MTQDTEADYSFLGDIRAELDAERDVDYNVTSEAAAAQLARYPKDTPPEYKRIGCVEFFDGAL